MGRFIWNIVKRYGTFCESAFKGDFALPKLFTFHVYLLFFLGYVFIYYFGVNPPSISEFLILTTLTAFVYTSMLWLFAWMDCNERLDEEEERASRKESKFR